MLIALKGDFPLISFLSVNLAPIELRVDLLWLYSISSSRAFPLKKVSLHLSIHS